MDNLVYSVAVGISSIIILSVCYVYVKNQLLQWGGVSLETIGMLLIGMPVWKTIKLSVDENGINATLDQLILNVDEAKQEALLAKDLANKTVKASLASLRGNKSEFVKA